MVLIDEPALIFYTSVRSVSIMKANLLLASLLIVVGACSSDETSTPLVFESSQEGDQWWLSVHVRSKSEQWVVGGVPGKGRIIQNDGAGWNIVDPGADVGLLNWVHGFDNGDLIIVGEEGTILDRTGGTWSEQAAPNQENLWGVWGASSDDVFAVGGSGTDPSAATLHRRQNGTWQNIPSGTGMAVDPERPTRAFFKVWGSSASDVWVVGQSGAVVHFDGSDWKAHHTGTAKDLIAVWGTGPQHVVAVGGRNNAVIAVYRGEWTLVEDDFDFDPGVNGVWTRGDTVHIAGLQGTLFTASVGKATKTGTTELPTDLDMHAIHAAPDGTITTVGGNFLFQNGPYKGAIFTGTLGSDQ
ncbi:MAG: hypothetical protein ACI9OJ_002541 [Myxococcota bacterium]|jgi:hypothetical protein